MILFVLWAVERITFHPVEMGEHNRQLFNMTARHDRTHQGFRPSVYCAFCGVHQKDGMCQSVTLGNGGGDAHRRLLDMPQTLAIQKYQWWNLVIFRPTFGFEWSLDPNPVHEGGQ